MHYAYEKDGNAVSGEVPSEAWVKSLAEIIGTDVQVWSHGIENDDARPLFYYDANGVKHSHDDGSN